MGSINDNMRTKLAALGYTGALSDMLSAFKADNNLYGNDSWSTFLSDRGYTGSLNDQLSKWGTTSVPVLLIGDSYTAPDGAGLYYSWPDYSTAISEKQYNTTSALAGKTLISGILPNIGTILSTFDAPYVALTIGANDLIAGTSLNDVQRAMMTVIKAIVDAGRKVAIGGMAPVLGATSVSVTAGEMELIKAYHSWLESICAEYGFEFVDYYDYLEGDTPDTYDPDKDHEGLGSGGDLLHPNEASARYISALWDTAIARMEAATLVTSFPAYYNQYFNTASDTRLYSASAPTGTNSNGTYTLSVWVNSDTFATIQQLFHAYYTAFTTNTVYTRINTDATVTTGSFYQFGITSSGTLSTDTNYHIVMSADHNATGGYNSQMYINGVKANTNDTAMQTTINMATAGVVWSLLNNQLGTQGLVGSFSDFWFDDDYIDLDTESNLRKFILANGKAADVYGTDGTDGTIGAAPLIFFGSRNTLAELNAGTNKGTGGVFSKSGTAFTYKF